MKKLLPWLPGAIAVASVTAFCAVLWWPSMFLVWAAAGLAVDWRRAKEAR